jgi:Phosphodiester glycosidase
LNKKNNVNTKTMNYQLLGLGGIFSTLLVATGCSNFSLNQAATTAAPQATPTVTESEVAPGIKMFANAAKKFYVAEIDLSKAELRSLTGAIAPGGKVSQMKFEEFWAKNNSKNNLQVLINGTFFQTYDKPTGIAFGLKQDTKVITYGYGLKEFPNQTVTVAWSQGRISIDLYSRRTFDGAMPNVVGALAANAGKNADKSLPRTFIGVKDLRDDGAYRTVLLFSSAGAAQSEAEEVLQKYGAVKVAMLDGGASTGLMVGGKVMMQPKTKLPQTIGVFSK